MTYEYLFFNTVLNSDVWEQVRIDHGVEFALAVFIQQVLSCYYFEEKAQFKQTRSTKNNVSEHMWPAVNQKNNCPVKRAINEIIC